jgi:hypothetical protein
MPTTAFIDASGKIVKVESKSFTADELRQQVEELF